MIASQSGENTKLNVLWVQSVKQSGAEGNGSRLMASYEPPSHKTVVM